MSHMEFLRFGSSIPGSYWGCCAVDIIQHFKNEPDAKASIELVDGDGGVSLNKYAGPTYLDIFKQRLRVGTFCDLDMPNHAFIAVLTEWQVKSKIGQKWLAILKEHGFEFIRAVDNSVYSGQNLGEPTLGYEEAHTNYIFALFRNIGSGGLRDPFTPPKQWTDLPSVKPEAWDEDSPYNYEELTKAQHTADTAIWNAIGKPVFLTEAEVVKAGAPVIKSGLRSKFPPQTKEAREKAKGAEAKQASLKAQATPVPTV